MAERPTAAFVLSLIGGVIVLCVGIIISLAGALISSIVGLGGLGAILGVFGIICGILMVVGAAMLYSRPQQHRMWSAIVLVFSILSWFGAAGGLFIGLILGLIGGILGIIWKPSAIQHALMSPSPSASSQTKREFRCQTCGAVFGTEEELDTHVKNVHQT